MRRPSPRTRFHDEGRPNFHRHFFRDYPQRQKAASFNLDEILAQMKQGAAK